MRLTPWQRRAIRDTVREVYGDDATVVLFGSRVDDRRRGGDIDLFIRASTSRGEAIQRKIAFLARLKRAIGDQRIDVVLETPDSDRSEIAEIAKAEGVAI